MSKAVISSSSNSDNKEIDKYHDNTSDSGSNSNSGNKSNSSSSSSSSGGNTTDEQYTFGVPGVPLEVLLEVLRTRATSQLQADTSTSVPFVRYFRRGRSCV